MPIWLRKFTFETLREHYEKQAEEMNKQQNMMKNKSSKDIPRPDIAPKQPTYTSNAPNN
jgi:hypothetical protein